jgi:hypothetical protein
MGSFLTIINRNQNTLESKPALTFPPNPEDYPLPPASAACPSSSLVYLLP